jgi:hypothetical protein
MSARKDLARELRKIVPKAWVIVDTDKALDETTRIALLISQRTIEPAPNAIGNHKVTLNLYVIDPHTDPDAAEDGLDDAVDTILFEFDRIPWASWTTASKVIYQGRRAYEIPIEAFTQPKE